MRRVLSLLLILILCLCLAGCRAGEAPELPETAGEETQIQPEEPEEPEETEEPEPLARIQLESLLTAEGLYDLSLAEEIRQCQLVDAEMMSRSEVLLLCGQMGDQLLRLDLETGELWEFARLEIQLAEGQNWANTEIDCVDPIVISDYYHERFYFYSPEGELEYVQEGVYWLYGHDFALRVEDEAYCWKLDLTTGEETVVFQLPIDYRACYLRGLSADESRLYLETTALYQQMPVTLEVDLASGEILRAYEGEEAYRQLTGRAEFRAVDDSPEGDSILTSSYRLSVRKGNQLWSRQLDLQNLVEREGLTPEWVWLQGMSSSGFDGRALCLLWDGTINRPLIWDYSDQSPEEAESQLVTYEPPVFERGDAGLRAEELAGQYGVEIFLGEQVLSAPYPDYTLSVWENESDLNKALDVLEEAFSLYPEGYLAQLGGESTRAICFYLSGPMTPVDPSVSIENPAGLACRIDGVEMIALNAAGWITVQNVVHELSHIMDHWLAEEGVLDEERWKSYNPEDFDYYYAYVDENGQSYEFSGRTTYTAWDETYYEGQLDTVAFVDPYSTTWPTEDRARLMENLFGEMDLDPPDFFASQIIQQKLSYYFDCIRAVCDTDGWPEQTVWESRLVAAGARG